MTEAQGAHVLLVEDDDVMREAVVANLVAHGYRVNAAPSGEAALELWDQHRADLVLLDLGLPGIDGIAVVRRLRKDGATPIIILSALDQERDKVAALDAGADDYLTKPFGLLELHARMRAALRRTLGPAADAEGQLKVGPLVLDPARRRATVDGVELHFTPREYELLKELLANVGRVASRGRLLRAVWGQAYADEGHYLHVHVGAIRRKLTEADPSGRLQGLIVAEPGIGYRVRHPDELTENLSGS